MRPPVLISRAAPAAATIAVALGLVVAVAVVSPPNASGNYRLLAIALTLAAGAYLVWSVEPVYTFCAAILLSPLSGNWEQLGVPGFASLDRLLLVAAIGAVVLRAPGVADRPRLRIEPVHWAMIAAVAFAGGSALFAQTLFERPPFFKLLETFGVLPFLVFLTAPLAFRTERERSVLLATLILLGAYLGLTTIFEKLNVDALVFPKYILDSAYGIHSGRGRGPFVEAVTNGYAQYVCAVIAALGWVRWRRRRPLLASAADAVAVVDIVGAVLSLERSVWLGAAVATIVALLAIGEARRYAPAVLTLLAVVVVGALAVIPGLYDEVQERGKDQQTIWDRKNLSRAAVNMLAERPLVGFGWDKFTERGADYFEQADDYPITRNVSRIEIHNVPLTYAANIGLIGLILWAAALALGIGGALTTRGSPELHAWRVALLAVAVCFVVVTNFVPRSVFPNLSVWLLAGVVWSGRYGRETGDAGEAR